MPSHPEPPAGVQAPLRLRLKSRPGRDLCSGCAGWGPWVQKELYEHHGRFTPLDDSDPVECLYQETVRKGVNADYQINTTQKGGSPVIQSTLPF